MITPFSFPRHGLRNTMDPLRTHSADSLGNTSVSFHTFVPCLLSALYINPRVLLGVSPVRTHPNTSSSPSYLLSRLQRPSRRSTPFSPDRIQTHKAGFVLSHMKSGNAKRWKEQYLKSREAAVDQNHSYTLATNGCFADFENELRKLFSDPYKKENALQQLQKIRQGKDTVDQHNIAFQLLVNCTMLNSLLNADILIQYYANSLNHHIREKILTSKT